MADMLISAGIKVTEEMIEAGVGAMAFTEGCGDHFLVERIYRAMAEAKNPRERE